LAAVQMYYHKLLRPQLCAEVGRPRLWWLG
jgi:hypothetical protein